MSRFKLTLVFLLLVSSLKGQDQKSYWPKQIDLGEYILTIYGPEAEGFKDNVLDARAAFSIYDKKHLPTFGAMWFRCNVHTDVKTNEVDYTDIRLMNANFPDATAETIEQLQQLIAEAALTWNFNSDLSRFYRGIESLKIKNEYSEDLKNNPPNIFYSKVPAVLVFIDGEPIMENINGSELYQFIVNSPHFIIKSSSDQQYYLIAGDSWYTTADPKGVWKPIETPPGYIMQLATSAGKLTKDSPNNNRTSQGKSPKLVVTLEPAELIQTKGEPEINIIHDNIFSITNSEDEILFDTDTDYYFILISGRWYKTKYLERGPWAFVPPEEIAEIFKSIPPTENLAQVRMSIPGTPEAISAALDNAIPQTAVVDRQKAVMQIEFDGPPQFAPIEGTSLTYGVNTQGSIIQDKDSMYYAMDQAIWFSSESIEGPWKAADNFPEEVRNIPPSCPLFNIKFVYIYDSSPNIVYTGYTAGYIGSFLYHGVVYYGTGYRYKPWYGNVFIPRPSTYGHGAKKKRKTNVTVTVGYGYGYGGYGYPGMGFGYPGMGYGYGYGYPYGGYGMGMYNTYVNPTFFAGQAPVDHGDTGPKPIDPVNIYNNRTVGIIKTETVRRNDPTKPVILTEPAPTDNPDNIFADKDGNVYRQESDGSVYLRQDSDWQKTAFPK